MSDPARVWVRHSMRPTALRPTALLAALTGLLVRFLLLLSGLLPAAALLTTLAALLVFLITLVRHELLLGLPKENAGFPLNVPNPN